MPVLPDGVVTFLFTDIEGSTRLWEQFPDAMRAALERHDSLLQEIIETEGGHIFKTVGDGVCAVFESAEQAACAARRTQQGLYDLPPSEFGWLRTRIALLTGQATVRANDYFGSAVNRTARLCSIAHGGQTLVAEATVSLLHSDRPDAVLNADLRDMGMHRFKDLRDAERVYQLICPGLPSDFPPLRSLNQFSHNLPAQVTSLVGRDADVAEAVYLLTGQRTKADRQRVLGEDAAIRYFMPHSGTRLLTLTGTGGCGKTRLALQAAAEVVDAFRDGVWLVELASLTDADLLPQAVARALGENGEQAGRAVQDTLIETLKSRALLLVLDNCEHLIAPCARFAATLLRACPGLRILATSREILDIQGETVLRVAPLPVPSERKSASPDSLANLMRYDAVCLFVERAQAALPTWTLSSHNAGSVIQICRQLDGIPLALELAARRVKGMTVETIAGQLSDCLARWTGSRADPPRQQTLEAAIGWSYDLLTDGEGVLLRRLSVFSGGWTPESAQAVCTDEEPEGTREKIKDKSSKPLVSFIFYLSPHEAADALLRLVDKSLVVFDEAEGGEGRYRLLETIRQYSLKRLEQAGELEAARRRHAAWCLEMAEQAEPQLQGAEQAQWLDRLEREHDNLRAALRWTVEAHARLRLASALRRFWDTRGYLTEGRSWIEGALTRGQDIDPPIRAKALNAAGILAWRQGDSEAAQRCYEQSLALYRALEDRQGEAKTLNNLGLVALQGEDYAVMRLRFAECLQIYQELGQSAQAAQMLNNLGVAAILQKEYEEARGFLNRSLPELKRIGDKSTLADVLHNLGEVALKQQDYATADTHFKEGLNIVIELGNRHGIEGALRGIANSALCQGAYRRAGLLYSGAQAIRESVHASLSGSEQAEVERNLALLRVALGAQPFEQAWAEGQKMDLHTLYAAAYSDSMLR